jgi:O-antigen ligase
MKSFDRIIIPGLLLGLLLSIFHNYIWILLVVMTLIIMYTHSGKKFLYYFILLSFLTLTNTINTGLRQILQIFGLCLLFYFFIKDNGFNFNKYPRIPESVLFFFFLLYCSFTLSMVFSNYKIIGYEQIIRTTIFFLLIYFLYSALFYGIKIELYLNIILIAALIYFIYIIYNFGESGFSLFRVELNQVNRTSVDYIHPNALTFMIVISSLLLMPFLFDTNNKKLIIFYLILFFIALIVANSREAFVCYLGGVLFIYYRQNKKILKWIITGVVLFFSMAFIEPFAIIFQVYFRLEKVLTGRNEIMYTVMQIIQNHFFVGVGPGGTKYELYKNLPYMLGSPQESLINRVMNQIEFGHAHNFYLFLFSDMGLLGLLTSIMLPVIFFRNCLSALKSYQNKNLRVYLLIIGITASGIALFLRGMFEWSNILSYGTITADLPFWILFVIIIYLNKRGDIELEKLLLV